MVYTIDYIGGSLLIHYMCDNTKMSELAERLHTIYVLDVILVN